MSATTKPVAARGDRPSARSAWKVMRDEPYFAALALLGLIGATAGATVNFLQRVPGVADVYLGAGIGFFIAYDLIVRLEKRNGELPPDRVRQLQRRGLLIGAVAGGVLFIAFNAARGLF